MSKHLKIAFIVLITLSSFTYSQTISLIPNEVYIGDTAEIRFNFTWNGNLFVEDNTVTKVTQTNLDNTLQNDYTIQSMELYPSNNGYTFSIIFSPWVIGPLDIQPIDIAAIFNLTTNSLIIDIPEVEIKSIFTAINDKKVIQEPIGPVIIPGTSYFLIIFITLIFILVLLLIIALTRINSIKQGIYKIISSILLSNNVKKACKKLNLLEKQISNITTKEFASQLSQIIRVYLEKHFSHPFTAETTTNFPAVFATIFENNTTEEGKNHMNNLFEVCTICDFLHYGENEAEKNTTSLEEKQSLILKTKEAFLFLEKPTPIQKDKEENDV